MALSAESTVAAEPAVPVSVDSAPVPVQGAVVRAYLERHRGELLAMLARPDESGIALARRHSSIVDGLVATLFQAAMASAPRLRSAKVLLAAVGGYGRQQLGLKSDLDVRFISDEPPERLEPIVEAMLYPLWDAGVSIGHQVITIDDAIASAKTDLTTATALLDCRPVAGDAALARALEERAFAELFDERGLLDLIERLERELADRHRRYGDSVYLLEPDVKCGAGGLRDLDLAWWAARARYRAADWDALRSAGALAAREAEELRAAADFFWSVRNHLHQRAGRRSDRLTFEEQETIAQALGYRERMGADPAAPEEQVVGQMAEAFMSDYYRHARSVSRLREHVFARVTPRLLRGTAAARDLGHGISAVGGQLSFSDPGALTEDPVLALRLYAAAVARGANVLAFARDSIAGASADPAFGAKLRASRDASALFVNLVCTARATAFRNGSVLAELHDVGLLAAMVPEFAPLVGRVHHDLYHVYTVDVHSVAAVDRLRELVRGELLAQQPLACRLAAEVTRPEVLFLATLLHDIGKTFGGKNHSQRGAEVARPILERLGLAVDDIDQICELVLHHLSMYRVAARRDLSEPATIAEFAHTVRGREALRDLYLLTVADISTTAPTSMTSWKARMLDELFTAADALLVGTTAADPTRLGRIRAQVRERCSDAIEPAFMDEYLSSMPERYLLANTAAEIAAHAEVAFAARGAPIQVRLVPSRHPDVAELCIVSAASEQAAGAEGDGAGLCVVAADRPGLLAAIAAVLTASKLEILAAQVYSRTGPNGELHAVDLFWVRGNADGIEGVERALPKLERDLRSVMTGAVAPTDLVAQHQRTRSRWSERPSPAVTTEVTVDNRTSLRHSIVEVITKDRPGLLFTLANALHQAGLTIDVAKVNTEGARVMDVFYVTELDGRKITTRERSAEVRQRLLDALPARA